MGVTLPGAAGEVKESYEISNSLRFNDDDSASLNATQSAGNRDTWTFSAWIKRGNLGTNQVIIISGSGASDYFVLNFNSSDKISWHQYNGSNYDVLETSDAVFRDTSAWYHIVLKVDTTDSTADNRVILYVNGSVASHTANTTFDQNEDTDFNNNGNTLDIGNDAQFNIGYVAFDGYMTEINFIDGAAKAQTDFGEFDDNGVWIPKRYTGSYGTNGFFLQFKQTGTSANSSGIGADTSGNDNHFAVTNLAATDVTEDTCTNNFATLVPTLNMTLSEGNVKAMTSRTSYWDGVHASIGLTSGKWYFETKVSNASGTFRVKSGVVGNPETFTILYNGQGTSDDPLNVLSNTYPSYGKGVWLSHWYDQNYDSSSTASAQSSGDILQFALDMDNYKMWIGVNGQFKDNSNNNVSYSDVASGSSATVTIASAAYTGKTFFPDVWLRDDDGSFDNVAEINFGNPSFSISSGNTDGKYGNFEYAVPSGFYAICTKRLAEFG